jgi:hypothetical protein
MPQIPRLMLNLFLILSVIIGTSSCSTTRTVLVPPGELIRLGPDIQGRVYNWDGEQWVLSDNKVKIPEGWVAGPPPKNNDN